MTFMKMKKKEQDRRKWKRRGWIQNILVALVLVDGWMDGWIEGEKRNNER